jgi:hypothetical protein
LPSVSPVCSRFRAVRSSSTFDDTVVTGIWIFQLGNLVVPNAASVKVSGNVCDFADFPRFSADFRQ